MDEHDEQDQLDYLGMVCGGDIKLLCGYECTRQAGLVMRDASDGAKVRCVDVENEKEKRN